MLMPINYRIKIKIKWFIKISHTLIRAPRANRWLDKDQAIYYNKSQYDPWDSMTPPIAHTRTEHCLREQTVKGKIAAIENGATSSTLSALQVLLPQLTFNNRIANPKRMLVHRKIRMWMITWTQWMMRSGKDNNTLNRISPLSSSYPNLLTRWSRPLINGISKRIT